MITATQALKTLNDEDQAAVVAGEKRIDAELAKYDGRPVRVDFANAHSKVLTRLCEMYREGGWLATIRHGDQREPGTWIEFTIASPPRSGPVG